ncbi:hypothetical protein CF327_g2377 [Tilletia walkeri]|nr:hypothetical protein CF327_g2377 [Tilletia walkeri]
MSGAKTSTSSSVSTEGGSGGARRVTLLDDEGDMTPKFRRALSYIFQKYASVPTVSERGRRIASSSSSKNFPPVLSSTEDGDGGPAAEEKEDEEEYDEAAARGREEEEAQRNEMRSSFGPSTTASTSQLPRASSTSTPSHPSTTTTSSSSQTQPPTTPLPILGSEPEENAVLSDAALDRFAFETNGAPFGAESKAEILEFLDVDEQGRLTFDGFLSMYSLQTENEEDETWRDLATHGFDANLELVSTRREDVSVDEGKPVPKNRLLGTGMGGPRDETRPDTPVTMRPS